MKRKILTVKNQVILYKKLRAYLVEILEDEENFDSADFVLRFQEELGSSKITLLSDKIS